MIFFKTGEGAIVKPDQWLPYSEILADELKADPTTNRGGFAEALAELLECLKNLDPLASVSDKSSTTPARSSAPAKRTLGKVSSKKLSEDEMLTEKAFKDKIFVADGFYKCKNCPSFKEKLEIRAKRHAH